MSDYRVRAVLEYYDKGFTAGMKSATSALNNAESASSTLGSKIKSGLGFGALMAIGQKAVNTVSNAIRNNLGSAVKRLDTLNNFPKIMKNLGYSADDAQSAINKMSKGIDGLPTALDDIAGATQKIAPLTKSLSKATDVTLALNNALLAGGKDAQTQANALEQFSQMLANGKVDMQSWRSMVQAMPGQMNQLAQSLLGPKANATKLYKAMKDGKVSFDDFNNALLKLNKKGLKSGGKQFASFEQQARDATKGIGTSMANLRTGIVKGLTSMIAKADGVLHISSNINKLSSGIKKLANNAAESKTFEKVLRGIGNAGKFIGSHVGAISKMAKAMVALWAASKGVSSLQRIGTTVKAVSENATKFVNGIKSAGGVTAAFTSSTAGVGLAAVGAVAGIALLAGSVYKLATQYKKAQTEAKKNAEARQASVDAVEAENGHIDSLYRRLEELNGVENKSKSQKKEMKDIVNQLNGAVDGLNIKYDEEKDKIKGGTKEIKKRIDAYKEQARTAALQDALKKAYKDQYNNEKKLASAHDEVARAEEKRNKMKQNGLKSQKAVDAAERKYQDALKKEKDLLNANKNINKEISKLGGQLKFDSNAFDDLVAKARKAGFDVPKGFVASFKQSGKAVPNSVFDLVAQMNPAFAGAVNRAKNAGVKIPDNIKTGIEQGKLKPQEAIKMINSLVDAEQKKMSGKSKTNGAAATNASASGIKGKGAVQKVKDAVSYVVNHSGNGGASAKGSSVGDQFTRGFAAGIKGKGAVGAVQTAASYVANVAKKQAAKAGKVHSPSRVMMQIGRYFTEGFAVGIKSGAKDVARATRDMVSIPSVRSPQLDLALAGSGSMSASVQYGLSNVKTDILDALSSRPIVVQPSVEIDGRQVAKTTAVYMQDEQNKLQTRENRKLGII